MAEITEEMKLIAANQIEKQRKEIDYNTRDYTLDLIVQKYRDEDFYIPEEEYQRQFVWDDNRKTRFIESLLLGLPIPFMFFSDTDDGRLEIIDGAQRTQTLEEFMQNDLRLSSLKRLPALNNFTYNDLPRIFKRKFDNTTMRIIVLSDKTTIETRQEIFHRINTTSLKATDSEIRRGSFSPEFIKFLKNCANNSIFKRLCPISETNIKRHEDLELVLRFFAYLNNYKAFVHGVKEFLDEYVQSKANGFDEELFKKEFERMLEFVDRYFEFGFRKTKGAKSTPRVRFEAIAVGVGLALRENPHLEPQSMEWLDSKEFKIHTTSHASNSKTRLAGRVEYVRDALLAGDEECN